MTVVGYSQLEPELFGSRSQLLVVVFLQAPSKHKAPSNIKLKLMVTCSIEVIVATVTTSIVSEFCVLCDAQEKAHIAAWWREPCGVSHIQYSCKVGQAAQAQKEVFEAIQQSKSFFILYSWILVQLFTAQTDGPIKKNISKKNKMYTLANPFQVFWRKQWIMPVFASNVCFAFWKALQRCC